MDDTRRTVLKSGGMLALFGALAAIGVLKTGSASAAEWNKAAFGSKDFHETLKALGVGTPASSGDVLLTAPDIAENGAVVPVTLASKLPGTESISLLVEKNPWPLAATFNIPEGTEPSFSTRVKMGETSNVHVLVKAGGKYYATSKEIKVTLGGCGG